ncbi:DUF3108 domain-containing protein [bacterium]|nr:DUF3108 domain-containing protein [bacterium]
MKKYLIILIFQLLVPNDIMKYEVSLYKVPMAEVTINYQNTFFQNKEAINLTFKTHTNKFASKIFKVNNDYETIIDPNNFNILSFRKNTYQPGLSNQLHTINKGDNVVYVNTDIIIPKNYFNIFSLLYYLTITPFEKVQTNIKLERESLLYDCIIKKNKTESFYEYELIFDLINKQQVPIIENTDMFTWAVFKENSYKKIVVDKNKKIKSCVFSVGLTSLRANLK